MNNKTKTKIKYSLLVLAIFLPILSTMFSVINANENITPENALKTNAEYYSIPGDLTTQTLACARYYWPAAVITTEEGWEEYMIDGLTRYYYLKAENFQNLITIKDTLIFQVDPLQYIYPDGNIDIHIQYRVSVGMHTSKGGCEFRIYNYKTSSFEVLKNIDRVNQYRYLDIHLYSLDYISDDGEIQVQLYSWDYDEVQQTGQTLGIIGWNWIFPIWGMIPVFGTVWPGINVEVDFAKVDVSYSSPEKLIRWDKSGESEYCYSDGDDVIIDEDNIFNFEYLTEIDFDEVELVLNDGTKSFSFDVTSKNSVILDDIDTDGTPLINGPVIATLRGKGNGRVLETDNINVIIKNVIRHDPIVVESGEKILGEQLYKILYDPNGDRSWSTFEKTSGFTQIWDWNLHTGFGIDIGYSVNPDKFTQKNEGTGVQASFDFTWGHQDHVEIGTTDSISLSSTSSWNAQTSNTGPGYGDTYWGETFSIPYTLYAKERYFFGSDEVDYVEPILDWGLELSAQRICGPDDAPQEWLDQNYVLQDFPAEADINWNGPNCGTIIAPGAGRDFHGTYTSTYTHTVTDSFLFEFQFDARYQPSFGFSAAVQFNFDVAHTWGGTEQIISTAEYHIEDFDEGDIIANVVGIDNRFGTYIFKTDTANSRSSDPYEHNTIDYIAPIIEVPIIELDSNSDGIYPCANDAPIITVDIFEEDAIRDVNVVYSIDNGITWNEAALIEQTANLGTWEGQIPAQVKGTTVQWYIEAIDQTGNSNERKDNWGEVFSYTITNAAPEISLDLPLENSEHSSTVLIEWTASDIDYDELTVNLFYWEDLLWKPIVLDIPGTSYTWDVSGITAEYTRIKVEATDGEYIVEDSIVNSIRIDV